MRVRHQYPLRAGAYLAQVMLPPDITHAEAQRLCEFVRSLVGKSKSSKHTDTPARGENRFFAETRPARASGVKLWSVRYEVITLRTGYKPRTHTRRLLVAARDQYVAAEVAMPHAVTVPDGAVLSAVWLDTTLVDLPVDLSEMETPATQRAGGRGYQAGYAAGLRAGYVMALQESDER